MTLTYLDTAGGLLFSPRSTFPGLHGEDIEAAFLHFLKSLAVFILMSLLLRAIILVVLFSLVPVGALILLSVITMLFETIMLAIGGVVMVIITGAWIHLWAYLWGARRGIEETIRATFYAYTPMGLLAWLPFALAGGAVLGGFSLYGSGGMPGALGTGFLLVIGLEILLLAWSFLIAVFGVADFQEMPEKEAGNAVLVAFLIPLLLGIALFLLLLSLAPSLHG